MTVEGNRQTSVLVFSIEHRIIAACAEHGIETVVVCEPHSWDKRRFVPDDVRVLLVDDSRVPDNILGALHRAGLGDHRFDAVVTGNEFELMTAGMIAKQIGARAIDPKVALRFRDKAIQKQYIRSAGIPTAQFVVIDDIWNVDAAATMRFERAVLKPIAGAGTLETSLVSSVSDLESRSQAFRAQDSYFRKFILEEFVPGDEWFADGVVFDGELLFFSLSKYRDPLLTVVREGLPLWLRRFDPGSEAWAYDRAEPLVRGALKALGLSSGVFHMEMFVDPDSGELTFGECAARYAGALTPEEVQLKFNVDLAESLVFCALGRRPPLDVKVRPGIVGNVYLPSRPGIVLSCPSGAELEALENVEFAFIDTPAGTVMPAGVGHSSQRLGQLLVTAESEERFVERAAELRAWFDERLVLAPVDASPAELWEWQHRVLPERGGPDEPFHRWKIR